MNQQPDDETFRMDVGSAEAGRTFVRVVHLPTGADKTQVGLNGETADVVGRRLAKELLRKIEFQSKHCDRMTWTPKNENKKSSVGLH